MTHQQEDERIAGALEQLFVLRSQTDCAPSSLEAVEFRRELAAVGLKISPADTFVVPVEVWRQVVDQLEAHHVWQLDLGTIAFCEDADGDPVWQDMTEAYSDSGMCEKTLQALAAARSVEVGS